MSRQVAAEPRGARTCANWRKRPCDDAAFAVLSEWPRSTIWTDLSQVTGVGSPNWSGDPARTLNLWFLDASILLAGEDPDDEHHGDARRLLEGGDPLATLDLAFSEVTNVAVRSWRDH